MRANERGQGLTEYVVFVSFVVVVVVVALRDDMNWRSKFATAMNKTEEHLVDCFPNAQPPSVARTEANPKCNSQSNRFVLDSENFDDTEAAP